MEEGRWQESDLQTPGSAPFRHTAFAEQQAFLDLPPPQQLLKIWLNGNETNGKVAAALSDIAMLKVTAGVHDRRLIRLETRYAVAAGVVAALVILAPFVFWGIDRMLSQG